MSSFTLEERLQRVEAALRWWRAGAVTLALLGGLAALLGAQFAEPRVINAEEIVLRDRDGRARMRLMVTLNGHPKVLLLDAKGEIRSQLTGEMLAFSERGRIFAHYGNGQDASHIQLYDGAGRRRASLNVDDRYAELRLTNGPHNRFITLSVDKNGDRLAIVPPVGGDRAP